ncbi:MAG TPA: hypothetical protein VLA99_02770 [Nitrospiraceae bacterium]|nr:hypothetical protein [Nitrospiraceae bacterium]
MANDVNLYFRLGHLSGLGMAEINSDSATPLAKEGTVAFVTDAFGPRILKYCKALNATAKGELMAYCSDGANVISTSVANITSGTTTSAVTSGLTADRHNGMICFVLDNADSAGAAPEGEMGIVADNTATAITLDPAYPLSTALAVNDDLELIATYQVEDAADGDEAWTVAGIVLGKDGISASQYGWVQQFGVTPALHTTNAIAEGDPVVAGAAVVDAFGTDGQELWVGTALSSCSTDEVLKHLPIKITVWASAGPGGSP